MPRMSVVVGTFERMSIEAGGVGGLALLEEGRGSGVVASVDHVSSERVC